MGYVERNLLPNEKVILKAQVHQIVFVAPLIYVGILFIFAALILVWSSPKGNISSLLCCVTLLFLILLVLPVVSPIITYFTTEFAVTDRRIIAKTGLLRQRSLELMLSKVESIGVSQPLMGRLMNYGTVVVIGTGGTREPFRFVTDPMSLRQRINAQIAAQ